MIYLFDTDHVTFYSLGTVEGDAIRRRLRNVGLDDYGTTVVSYEEQCRGWLNKIHQAQTSEARIESYFQLKASLLFFTRIAVLEYDARADAKFVELKKIVKNKIGTKDLRIASIGIVHGATVLTRNIQHFAPIPGCLYADWTI